MLRFGTLGPAGSNHELVAKRYTAFHGLTAHIVLFDDFEAALRQMSAGTLDHILQAAVHHQTAAIVAKARFQYGIFVIDSFIAPSHPLAVLTLGDVERPRTVAVQPSTRDYADLSLWEEIVEVGSTALIAEALLARRYDSGMTRRALVAEYPGRFRVETDIGTIDDPWIVLGRHRVAHDRSICAWPDSPAATVFRQSEDAR